MGTGCIPLIQRVDEFSPDPEFSQPSDQGPMKPKKNLMLTICWSLRRWMMRDDHSDIGMASVDVRSK